MRKQRPSVCARCQFSINSAFLSFTVIGIVTGCIYGLTATGLVVTYTTSGIFNFAHGAIGMAAAYTYWQFHVGWGWPTIPSPILSLTTSSRTGPGTAWFTSGPTFMPSSRTMAKWTGSRQATLLSVE